MRIPIPVLLLVLSSCDRPDIEDDRLPTDDTLPKVGSGALKFYGRVPKNVIFLSMDTFRKDHLGHYSGRNLTPSVERPASVGVTLGDHMQCSTWTFGSTTCTLAGRD